MLVDCINTFARKMPAWPLYLVLPLQGFWTLYLGLTGALGAEPIKALEHALGLFALQLLIAGLAITPARKHLGLNLLKFRRAIGVMAFTYVAAHLLVWLILDVQLLGQIWADIVKRPYITVGMVGFVLMVPLAVTSNNWSVRRLGPKWRKLHKLTYGVVLLGALHFVMLVKGFQAEPLIYMALVLGLLALRFPQKRRLRNA